MLLVHQLQDSDSPVGVLASLNLDQYDRGIADFQKKRAELDTERDRATAATRELEAKIRTVLKDLPALEARHFSNEFRLLRIIDNTILDGITPPDISNLLEVFEHNKLAAFNLEKQAMRGINVIHKAMKKLDANLATDMRRVLNEVAHTAKRLNVHYEYMSSQVRELIRRSKGPLDGPVKRADSLYREALSNADGVRGLGNLSIDFHDSLPVYELPIHVDPAILDDRSRLRNLEQTVNDYVEQRDPTAVGMIVFRFEPLYGAA